MNTSIRYQEEDEADISEETRLLIRTTIQRMQSVTEPPDEMPTEQSKYAEAFVERLRLSCKVMQEKVRDDRRWRPRCRCIGTMCPPRVTNLSQVDLKCNVCMFTSEIKVAWRESDQHDLYTVYITKNKEFRENFESPLVLVLFSGRRTISEVLMCNKLTVSSHWNAQDVEVGVNTNGEPNIRTRLRIPREYCVSLWKNSDKMEQLSRNLDRMKQKREKYLREKSEEKQKAGQNHGKARKRSRFGSGDFTAKRRNASKKRQNKKRRKMLARRRKNAKK